MCAWTIRIEFRESKSLSLLPWQLNSAKENCYKFEKGKISLLFPKNEITSCNIEGDYYTLLAVLNEVQTMKLGVYIGYLLGRGWTLMLSVLIGKYRHRFSCL